MKKALSIVLSTILLLALLVIPAHAAQSVSVSLPVTQTVTLEGEGAKAEDAVVNYALTAVTTGAPMPDGAQNGSFSFTLTGEMTYQMPTIVFSSIGTWTYRLNADGSSVDPTAVTITVYVTEGNTGLSTIIIAKLANGEKTELAFTAVAKAEEPQPPEPPEPVTYTVTFETFGGTTVPSQTVEEGDTATEPEDPTREGYTFGGWYLDEDCTVPYDFSTPVTEDITIYAKWTKNEEPTPPGPEEPVTYTVTFETFGGTTVPSQTVKEGDTATKPQDPTRDGYTFGGWYLDEDCTIPYDFSTPVTGDITIYAKWTKNEEPTPPGPEKPVTYTVTFETDGGTTVPSQTVEEGNTAAKPQDPIREGYTFGGWFMDKDCTIPYDFSTPVTGDITLYAKWTKIDEPTPPGPHTGEFETWSLVNLICAVLTAGVCAFMVATARRNKGKLLGVLPAVAAGVIFLLYEHMSLPMQLCDKFTPLMVGLLLINVMLAYLTHGKAVTKEVNGSK